MDGEVLANLLQNAIRHSPRGSTVTLAARPTDAPASRAVELSVIDDGAGIPDELLPHVFDRFVKGADSDGSGLGLAIAKSLVEAHGGSISAHAAPGGTELSVILPIDAPASGP